MIFHFSVEATIIVDGLALSRTSSQQTDLGLS